MDRLRISLRRFAIIAVLAAAVFGSAGFTAAMSEGDERGPGRGLLEAIWLPQGDGDDDAAVPGVRGGREPSKPLPLERAAHQRRSGPEGAESLGRQAIDERGQVKEGHGARAGERGVKASVKDAAVAKAKVKKSSAKKPASKKSADSPRAKKPVSGKDTSSRPAAKSNTKTKPQEDPADKGGDQTQQPPPAVPESQPEATSEPDRSPKDKPKDDPGRSEKGTKKSVEKRGGDAGD